MKLHLSSLLVGFLIGALLVGGTAWSQGRTLVTAHRDATGSWVSITGTGNVLVACTARDFNDAPDERMIVTRENPTSMDVTVRCAKR